MVSLRPLNLRWIQGAADDPHDLCAHGDIDFRIGEVVLLGGERGKDLTVSAAALYLLRTLSTPHTKDVPVGEHLFPCCGFCMYDTPDSPDVVICGCPNGEDFEVRHDVGGAGVVVCTKEDEWRVSWPDWRNAVFAFADAVSDFYAACSPKQPETEDDAQGISKFAAEWARRRGEPLKLVLSDRPHNTEG